MESSKNSRQHKTVVIANQQQNEEHNNYNQTESVCSISSIDSISAQKEIVTEDNKQDIITKKQLNTTTTKEAKQAAEANTNTLNVITPHLIVSNSCSNSSASASSSSSNSSTSSISNTIAKTSILNQTPPMSSNNDLSTSSFVNDLNLITNDLLDIKRSQTHTERSNSVLLSNTSASSAANLTVSGSGSPEAFKRTIFSSFRESSYKKQKENYLTEKKRINNDMLTIMRDERIIVLADWLKVRGSLKNWIKLYVILKPGILLLYKSDKIKAGQWIGTVLLNSCQLLERPSKKHGFCFKLFHPMEKSIWASKGPAGETYINVPYMLLPAFYLIFRAPSEKIGNIWMDALELTLKSSHLLKPPTTSYLNLNGSFGGSSNDSAKMSQMLNAVTASNSTITAQKQTQSKTNEQKSSTLVSTSSLPLHSQCSILNGSTFNINSSHRDSINLSNGHLNTEEIENKHFKEICFDNTEEAVLSDSDAKNSSDDVCSLNSSFNNADDNLEEDEFYDDDDLIQKEKIKIKKHKILANQNESEDDSETAKDTKYIPSPSEEFGELGNKGQTEEVGEEDKSLIFCLVKQVRPGMDLSKVVLPTFILEPRSFLEKLTDFYYHSDILTETLSNEDPFERMKSVVKFYLSGFYKKPKGLKKPYNPILGEVFRSYWFNPKTQSKTFYIAEQVSHHPPITSFYVSNRKEGFCIYGTILARSKFYGNSVSAIMEGHVKLILLNRGEEYIITLPYANCKGILLGKLTMELGGKINIECVKTGYSADIEFKLKPLLGGIEASNLIDGKIKFAKETIATLHGKWDGEITLQEKRAEQNQSILWNPTKQIIESRLKRFIVPLDEQMEFESEKLWIKVSDAIKACDQHLATEHKTKIELKQRENDLERKTKFIEYHSKLFTYDSLSKEWLYNYSDLRPWDPQTDLFQYESNFKIMTKAKHNLKLSAHCIKSPCSSLLTLHHRQTPHLRHHPIISNVVESNECIATNESYDLLVQYNDIKQRLDHIEDNLTKINHKIDSNQTTSSQITKLNTETDSLLRSKALNKTVNDYINKTIFASRNQTYLSQIVTKTNLFIALLAWFVGLFSAILSQKFF